MDKPLEVLGIDVGRETGYFFSDEEYGNFKFESLCQYHSRIKYLIDLFNPDVIVSGKPNRHYKTLEFHFSLLALIQLECEKRGILYHGIMDSQAKKEILGKGNAGKIDVIKWARIPCTSDEADAKMFAEWGKSNAVISS